MSSASAIVRFPLSALARLAVKLAWRGDHLRSLSPHLFLYPPHYTPKVTRSYHLYRASELLLRHGHRETRPFFHPLNSRKFSLLKTQTSCSQN